MVNNMIVKKKRSYIFENLQIVKFLPYFIQTVNFNVFLHAISPFRKKKIKELNLDMIYWL